MAVIVISATTIARVAIRAAAVLLILLSLPIAVVVKVLVVGPVHATMVLLRIAIHLPLFKHLLVLLRLIDQRKVFFALFVCETDV